VGFDRYMSQGMDISLGIKIKKETKERKSISPHIWLTQALQWPLS
jgi:hypothetical protein